MGHICAKVPKRVRPTFAMSMSNPEGILMPAEMKDMQELDAAGFVHLTHTMFSCLDVDSPC